MVAYTFIKFIILNNNKGDMMAYTITASLDPEVHAWVMAEKNKSKEQNLSRVVNFYLRGAMLKKKETPQMLTCPKHPGASYSSVLIQCPMCAEEETIKKIEEADIETIESRKGAIKELEEINAKMVVLSKEINELDTDTETGKTKQDKLFVEFDKLKARKDEILAKI